MYNQTGAGATQAQYWSDVMGGFKNWCRRRRATGPVGLLQLHRRGQQGRHRPDHLDLEVPGVLGLPSYSIQSPTALQQYDANNVVAQGDSFVYPAYATEHLTGAGPYKSMPTTRPTTP